MGPRAALGSPTKLVKRLNGLLVGVIQLGHSSKRVLQQIMGHVAPVLEFRREIFAFLHHTYKFVESMPERAWISLRYFVCDELRAIALHMP